jgi:hypothetical protein
MTSGSDEPASGEQSVRSTENEVKELMGLFDAPAFARRGRDVEWAVNKTLLLCRQKRLELLEMVHCRLRMWSAATTGPADWPLAFQEPIDHIWIIAEAPEPLWKGKKPPTRKALLQLSTGLVQSVDRFNTRWLQWVEQLQVDSINRQIDHYNKYYILEKECIVGSTRLAARLYQPQPRIEPDWLLGQFPLLPVPKLK